MMMMRKRIVVVGMVMMMVVVKVILVIVMGVMNVMMMMMMITKMMMMMLMMMVVIWLMKIKRMVIYVNDANLMMCSSYLSFLFLSDARDAIGKQLYGRLFSWIVNKVNTILAPREILSESEQQEIGKDFI